MNIFEKALTWFKANNRKIEKITLLVGSIILLAIGLVFNIYADTMLNITVGYLIFGLVTTIAGGALMLWGLYMNLFDINYKGLAIIEGGLILAVFNIFLYPGYLSSELFLTVAADLKSQITVIFTLMEIFSIIAVVLCFAGFGLQIYQRAIEFKDKKKLLCNLLTYTSAYSIAIALFIELCLTNVAIFNLVGILEHIWISLLFLPLSIATLLVLLLLNKDSINTKLNNTIVVSATALVLILTGTSKFMATNVTYDSVCVDVIRDKITVKLPEKIEVVSNKTSKYEVIYGKVLEGTITTNKTWQTTSHSDYEKCLPQEVIQGIENYEYFYFTYVDAKNASAEKVDNSYPKTAGTYTATYIAYNKELNSVIIVKDMSITIEKGKA